MIASTESDLMLKVKIFSTLLGIFFGSWLLLAIGYVLAVEMIQMLWWEQIPNLSLGSAFGIAGLMILWTALRNKLWEGVAKRITNAFAR